MLPVGSLVHFSVIQPAFVMNSYPRIIPRMFVYSILVEKPQDSV